MRSDATALAGARTLALYAADRLSYDGSVAPGNCNLHRQSRRAMLATQHLIEQGRRTIAIITGPLTWWEARERLAGWQRGLAQGNRAQTPELIYEVTGQPPAANAHCASSWHAALTSTRFSPATTKLPSACCVPATSWVAACPMIWQWSVSTTCLSPLSSCRRSPPCDSICPTSAAWRSGSCTRQLRHGPKQRRPNPSSD